MRLFSWLREQIGTDGLVQAARPRRLTATPARSYRPRLEALEDRWVPSTLTVRNNLDSGAGSLRAKIAAAHKNETGNAPTLLKLKKSFRFDTQLTQFPGGLRSEFRLGLSLD